MNTNLKKGLLILLGSYIVYWAFVKMKPFGGRASKKSKAGAETSRNVAEDKKNALIVLTAYKNAKDAGEPKSFLDEMNAEFAREYKLRVVSDKGSGKLIATDLAGNKVL